jgi:hypothetical protein
MPNQAFYFELKGQRIYPANIIYLNARREPFATMNAVLFVVKAAELALMDGREWIYRRHLLTDELRGVRVVGGEAAMYVARKEHLVRDAGQPAEAAVRASYVRMLETALQLTDPAFRNEYTNSTDPVPADLVIDDKLDDTRPNPWLAAGKNYRPPLA